jgi:phage anti-repressor protein
MTDIIESNKNPYGNNTIEDIYDAKKIKDIEIEFLSLLKSNLGKYNISLKNVYEWLEMPELYSSYKTDKSVRTVFRRGVLSGENYILDEADNENDLGKGFIIRKGEKGINYPWFSVDGFKTFVMTLKRNKKAYLVRKYFLEVERNYWDALNRSEKENKAKLKKLNSDIDRFVTRLDKVEQERDVYLGERFEVQRKLKKTRDLERVLDKKDDFLLNVNGEYSNYIFLQKLFLKPISLYVVNPDYMKQKSTKTPKEPKQKKEPIVKKPFDLNSDSDDSNVTEVTNASNSNTQTTNIKGYTYDDTSFEYEKNFNDYSLQSDIIDNPTDEPLLYYCIGPYTEKTEKPKENFYKIGDLYVKDMKHLKELKTQLEKPNDYRKEYLYKAHYSSIHSMNVDILNKMLRKHLQTL